MMYLHLNLQLKRLVNYPAKSKFYILHKENENYLDEHTFYSN